MFRWGVLSTAKIARDQLLPAIQDAENGVLTAVASRDEAQRPCAGGPLRRAARLRLLRGAAGLRYGRRRLYPAADLAACRMGGQGGRCRQACAGREAAGAARPRTSQPVIAARDRNKVLVCEAFMVVYHPQWIKVRELVQGGAIGRLRHVQGAFSYYNVDPDEHAQPARSRRRRVARYRRLSRRLDALRHRQGAAARPGHGRARPEVRHRHLLHVTKADFGDFDLSFYCSTQMALRQFMVFHGEKGFIEVHAPFNAGDYDHHRIELHNQKPYRGDASSAFRGRGSTGWRSRLSPAPRRAARTPVFTLEDSVQNQTVIDAIFRAGEKDGWEKSSSCLPRSGSHA